MNRKQVIILISVLAGALLVAAGACVILLRDRIYPALGVAPKHQLVLGVRVEDAVLDQADRTLERLRDRLVRRGLLEVSLDTDNAGIAVRGLPGARAAELRSLAADTAPEWILTATAAAEYRLDLRPAARLALEREAVEQTAAVIRRRLRSLGVAAQVTARDTPRIEVRLYTTPDDPGRLKQVLATLARLEVAEVKDGPFASREQALAKHGGVLPLNTKLVPDAQQTWYLVSRVPVITGGDLRKARPFKELDRWETGFTLSSEAGARFGRFTEANIGNRLAIILDDQVRSAPEIQSRIESEGRTTGLAGRAEAADLALMLETGALPARVVYLEER